MALVSKFYWSYYFAVEIWNENRDGILWINSWLKISKGGTSQKPKQRNNTFIVDLQTQGYSDWGFQFRAKVYISLQVKDSP